MTQTHGENFPKRGDLYWVSFDPTQGSETKKTRPAVVISNNAFNKNLNRIIVAPITSNVKNIYDFDCPVTIEGRKGKAMLDQLRSVDKSRLKSKIGSLPSSALEQLEQGLKLTFALI